MRSSTFVSRAAGVPASLPLRIVLADDERDTVLTLTALLRDEGHDVRGFTNGREALAAVLNLDPDVVILDVAMPGLDGWDVARQIRVQSGGARPLLIAMSGRYSTRGHKIFADMVGFNHYLTKPCALDALVELLRRLTR
jgi:two-component system, chemotaxis family, CheB/CheR fusion protein